MTTTSRNKRQSVTTTRPQSWTTMNEPTSPDLFPAQDLDLGPGAVLLREFARPADQLLLAALADILTVSPFRHMVTPGGYTMSVAMTNCGQAGWISDRCGYRYSPVDPTNGRPWPAIPAVFANLATQAAGHAGFPSFIPDACLINRYAPGTRLTLHQDRNERDLNAPIVSVSLGLPATFLWGGQSRSHRPRRVNLNHGDVVVWGGPARMTFHGIDTLRDGRHEQTSATRYNLTFRQAL